MTCDRFRSRFAPSTDDAGLLAHARACESCLAVAIERDPDMLFRSLGGAELIPPGGIDLFVDDVMREVRLRTTETTMAPRPVSWTRRLAIAATIALGIVGGAAIYQYERATGTAPMIVHRAALRPVTFDSRPAVEAYDSLNATIVEVPTEGVEDVRMVMVFDDTLPADL